MICGVHFEGPFTAIEARAKGRGSWVYVIYDGNGPRYVGQSQNLATRFLSHPHHFGSESIYVAAIPEPDRLAVERLLISKLNPPNNKSPGRPPKPRERKQTAGINLRMTQAERDEIDAVAGTEPGVWARGVLLRVARRLAKQITEDLDDGQSRG